MWNAAIKCFNPETVVVIHHDVSFDDGFLSGMSEYASGEKIGVVGVAGSKMVNSGNDIRSSWNFTHGRNRFRCGRAFSDVVDVDTVDECSIAFRPDGMMFDDSILRTHHCYAVDLSLQMSKSGRTNIIAPLKCHHRSVGNDEGLKEQADSIREKWGDEKRGTTTGIW